MSDKLKNTPGSNAGHDALFVDTSSPVHALMAPIAEASKLAIMLGTSMLAWHVGLYFALIAVIASNVYIGFPADVQYGFASACGRITAYSSLVASYVLMRRRWPGRNLFPVLGPQAASRAFWSLTGASCVYLVSVLVIGMAGGAPALDPGYDWRNGTAVMFIVLAAAAEEIVARAYVYAIARTCLGAAPAMMVSSFLFAALHARPAPQSLQDDISLFAFGIMTSTLAVRYRTLLPGIVVHAVYNYFVGLLPLQMEAPLNNSGVFVYGGDLSRSAFTAQNVAFAALVVAVLAPGIRRQERAIRQARKLDRAAMSPGSPDRDTPRINLSTQVDTELLDKVQLQLSSILYTRLLAKRDLYNDALWRHGLARFISEKIGVICTVLSAGGMATCLSPYGWPPGTDNEQRFQFAWVFLAAPVIGWLLQLKRPALLRWSRRPWPPCWRWLAGLHSRIILKPARTALPFMAEYTFNNDYAAYARFREGRPTIVWRRRLDGWRLDGELFTLLFKEKDAPIPYGIILHQRSAALSAHFDNMGVRALVLDDAGRR